MRTSAKWWTALLAAPLLLWLGAPRADVVAHQGPNELIESVAQSILKVLDARRDEFKAHPEKIRELVDEYMLPHFDTQYSARLVLAKHWRDATPEQRERFVDAFYQSMLQNYGEALLEFTPDRLQILPFRGDADSKNATVRTEVKRSNGTLVPVNYSLHKTPDGWKAWDVTIEGISYIKSFRTDFGSEIDQKGIDAVIERLEKQLGTKPAGDASLAVQKQ
jgi:phospholipid transport system substrate-binding protein